jgi:predicted transcriptional regulator
VGAAIAAFVPAFAKDTMGWGWSGVFAVCSVLVFTNLIPLFFYDDPVDERQTAKQTGSPLALLQDSLRELFSSPILLGFIVISAGFWFSFHQLFDLLPNFVDDWTDSSVLLAQMGAITGNETWIAEAAAGVNIPQEKLININALMIMFTMFFFAWLSSRVSTLASTILGMGIASLALISFVYTANVYVVLAGIVAFTVGEMLSSPKRQEYMSSLAPPGKRALYLGYANMPDGLGWVLGSLIAGAAYEEQGDKVNLTRGFVAEHGQSAAVTAWLDDAEAGRKKEADIKELVKNLEVADATAAYARLRALSGPQLVGTFAEEMPRGEVMDFALAAVPTLPSGQVTTANSLRAWLFAEKQPGAVWWPFVITGLASAFLMVLYDRWARSGTNRDMRVNPVYAGGAFGAVVAGVLFYVLF